MNEQLQKNLNGLLEFLQKGMMQAYDVSKQEVPIYIQEYLTWYFYEHLISVITGLIILGVLWLGYIFIYKQTKIIREVEERLFTRVISLIIVCGLTCIIVTTTIISDIKACVKVKLAPRVILMEKVKELIK